MNLALDSKLTGQLTTCSKEVFRTLIDLNEKVNAEFGNRPFTRLAFDQMLVAMSVYLAEMFPDSHIPAITGTYCIETGVVDLPNLMPVIEKLVSDSQWLRPTKPKDTTMQDSKPFTAQTFSKAATEEMQPRTPHPDGNVEAIMRKIEDSPLLTENEKNILFSHVQDGSQYAAPLPISITKDDNGHFCIAIADRKWKICRHGIIGINEPERREFSAAAEKAAGRELEFTTDIEITIPYGRHSYLQGRDHEYKKLLASRGNTEKSLGQIAYEYYQSSTTLSGDAAPLWADIPKDGPVCASWELLGRACYYSVGIWPEDTEKTIQILATRRRLELVQETGQFNLKTNTEFASFLNLVAGPPSERKV